MDYRHWSFTHDVAHRLDAEPGRTISSSRHNRRRLSRPSASLGRVQASQSAALSQRTSQRAVCSLVRHLRLVSAVIGLSETPVNSLAGRGSKPRGRLSIFVSGELGLLAAGSLVS